MKASTGNWVSLTLWALLVAGGCWAAYSGYWLLWLAHSFPSLSPDRGSGASVTADTQGYAVVFGPVMVVAMLFAFLARSRR
jgi:hypothetical protein